MNRAQRRLLKKKNKGSDKLVKKMESFGHRPDSCSACDEPFDAKSKEHAQTWQVVVREEPMRVSLFCPKCIKKTQEVIDANANN